MTIPRCGPALPGRERCFIRAVSHRLATSCPHRDATSIRRHGAPHASRWGNRAAGAPSRVPYARVRPEGKCRVYLPLALAMRGVPYRSAPRNVRTSSMRGLARKPIPSVSPWKYLYALHASADPRPGDRRKKTGVGCLQAEPAGSDVRTRAGFARWTVRRGSSVFSQPGRNLGARSGGRADGRGLACTRARHPATGACARQH